MLHKKMFVLLVVVLSLAVAAPVFAGAPGTGVVVEGERVPGIALGDSRAEIQAAYGSPSSCQSGSSAGDYALCAYPVDGGGRVWVHYRGAGGGGPSNSPDDVGFHIRWEESVSGWTTTAGVNTALAASDPDAVIAAYPNAVVTYNPWGAILEVKDSAQGIQVNWSYDFYSGARWVSMAISYPSQPPPPPEPVTRVTSITLTASKVKGKRLLTALVAVEAEGHQAAAGATVQAAWALPDGRELAVEGVTSTSGLARFEFVAGKRGVYTFAVDDVLLDGHRFDRAGSVLRDSIRVR